MIQENTRFLIVGLGLIGGSYAMGSKKNGYHVGAIEINQFSIGYTIRHNIIDRGSTFGIDYTKETDIIMSGLCPNMTVDWITTYQKYLKPGTLITDVSSVKTGVVEPIQKVTRRDMELVSSHPMAGKEISGVKFAGDSTFHIANFIILPTESNTKEAVATMRQFAEILGLSDISELTIAQHDEMIGFVSHLTRTVAVSLMSTNDNTHLIEYTDDSFRDLTGIMRINENLWNEIFFLNKENLIREIDGFIQEVNHLKTALEQNDVDGLKELSTQSTTRRKLFNR